MYECLGEATLKTGERIELGVITAPDDEWRDRIVPFLGHKGEPYATHLRRSHAGPLDALETRYYIGHRDGQVISEVMIVGARGAGVLGHVFTLPEERRKGAYQAVMAAQMADMPRRGFQLLSLGTGFDSAPYWIYHSFGFRSIRPDSGTMRWTVDPEAEPRLFRPAAVSVREARWDDWGYFAWIGLTASWPDEELPRSRVMGVREQSLLEGPFVRLLVRREETAGMTVRVLESETGATVAWAILAPDPSWPGDAWLLDLHAHPAFSAHLADLLAEFPWPDGPVGAVFTEPAGPKAAALAAAGFIPLARLPGWLRAEAGQRRDARLWVRAPRGVES